MVVLGIAFGAEKLMGLGRGWGGVGWGGVGQGKARGDRWGNERMFIVGRIYLAAAQPTAHNLLIYLPIKA